VSLRIQGIQALAVVFIERKAYVDLSCVTVYSHFSVFISLMTAKYVPNMSEIW